MARTERQLAAARARHRRGGTHRLKEEHRTGTKWDYESWATLKQACMQAQLYIKDMPKHAMIKLLAENDRRQRINGAREARLRVQTNELTKKKQEEDWKHKQEAARKRAEITDTEDKQEEHNTLLKGLLSESSDSSFSESESSDTSPISPIHPEPTLRLFEWHFPDLPRLEPPHPYQLRGKRKLICTGKLLPKKVPYIPLKLTTSLSREVLQLPGRIVAGPGVPAIGAVPMISRHTANCARNGIMVGPLSNTTIERGSDWAARTMVQWWNGRMYFNLPPRSSEPTLAEVYGKWRGHEGKARRKMLLAHRVKKTTSLSKVEQRKHERDVVKRMKLLEVYASSEFRPAMCFLPAYLDYPRSTAKGVRVFELASLFYIRLPGLALPQYCFWVREGDWLDPTMPNPEFLKQIENPVV